MSKMRDNPDQDPASDDGDTRSPAMRITRNQFGQCVSTIDFT